MTPQIAGLCLCLLAPAALGSLEAEPLRVLLLTGQNNHNWRYTSRVHKDTLEATGRFLVDIADDTPAALADGSGLGKYAAFVLDYNGARWGESAEANFLQAVRQGTGVVVIHAANNAFPGWVDYERMCGLLWRQGTGHGRFHAFDVRYLDPTHPVTAGLPDMRAHPDELYHKLVNTQGADFRILATAFSTTESGGTGQDEPMAIVLSLGKGRIFHTPLGHVWEGQHAQKASISDPQFKLLLSRGTEWAATGEVTIGTAWQDRRTHNTLSSEERAAGWQLLFDGSSAAHFRGYKQAEMPGKGWIVEEGALRHVAGQGGGDIITREQYGDFEFACEWKVAKGANSGIMYRVAETDGPSYMTGPELQILDNAGHADRADPKTSAGALYGLVACRHDVVRPAGEWNAIRIVVKDGRIEHWVNGWKVVEASLADPAWSEMLKGTKFEPWKDFGRMRSGHIALQDHGDDVWFRNVKVRAAR